jgi:transcription elongation factor Elf1
MEEKKIKDEKLEKVAGGLDTIFYGNVPICPVCGERDIKVVASDEFTDTYKCHNCGMESIHTKKERPAPPKYHPNLQCRQCGSIGQWNLVKSENGIDTVQCKVCRLQMNAPSEQ